MPILGKNTHVGKSQGGNVSLLRHNQTPYTLQNAGITINSSRELAKHYLQVVNTDYAFDPDMLTTLDESLEVKLRSEGSRLRFAQTKQVKNSRVIAYTQTHMGIPIWKAGFNVRMHADPLQVISSQSTVHHEVDLELPQIKNTKTKSRTAALKIRLADSDKSISASLAGLGKREKARLVKITSVKPFIYQYLARDRQDPDIESHKNNSDEVIPVLALPDVPESIEAGKHYVVFEVLFTMNLPAWGEVNWRAMVEIGTSSILYLRPFVQATDGLIYPDDPIRMTGNTSLTACSPATDLDPLRVDVELLGLTAGDPQALTGEYITISETNAPNIAPPAESAGTDFDYSAITDNFAAVNAYYHLDALFRMVEDFGFGVSSYFAGTTFPIPTDHRGHGGANNAAHWGNDAGASTSKFTFGLLNAGCPVGYATDRAPVIHEFAHSCLQNNIADGVFSWCHGFGDALGVVMSDPGSQAPDRFMRSPFMNSGAGLRRHDRDVAGGWAWDGSKDVAGLQQRRQILSTTMFRAYRSTGGDDVHGNAATQLARHEFASRYMAYLMLGAVGTMTSAAPPSGADDFATALIDFDQANADFEGHPGGAFHKVIRWAFEKQGLYQPAGAPTPVTSAGAPPDVDVYINDGRNGEYEWRQNFWNTTDIWSSRTADETIGHETPLLDETNYLYVRVKNRGTATATNVLVKAYHCRPSTGLVWPDDWQTMETAELPAPNILSGGEAIVGPFEWIPEVEGHECLLASVSADGDASNADTVNGPVPHWRLVPFDNNIGQRNVSPEPGGDSDELVSSLTRRAFWVNNPYDKVVNIEIEANLPTILSNKNWKIKFHNPGANKFRLGPGDERKIEFSLVAGSAFSAGELKPLGEALDIQTMTDGLLLGGMTYHIDPKLKEKFSEHSGGSSCHCGTQCNEASSKLLECMGLPSRGVKNASLRKVTIDITFKDDEC